MQEISKILADKYEEVIGKINSFSNEYLNKEYNDICVEATKLLFLNNETIVKKGKSDSWAAGIVHAIGSVNGLFDSKEEPYIKALDLYKKFGVSSSTGSNKSKEVKSLLGINEDNKKWILSSVNEKDSNESPMKNEAATTAVNQKNNADKLIISNKYVEAQRIVNRAWREKNYNSKAKYAREALNIYEDCSDAYIILSNDAKLSLSEKTELLRRAVKAAQNALKIDKLENADKRIFKLEIAQPLFGAKYVLAQHLWKEGERDEAIKEASEIIQYNTTDDLLVRRVLSSWLLIEEKYDEAYALLDRCIHDYLAATCYNRAALLFKTGKKKEAESALRRAYRQNKFVMDYLLKKKTAKSAYNGSRIGSEDEAAAYSELGLKVWNNSEIRTWLKDMNKNFEILNFR
ncbi:DUF6398 domain-containing protein [Clostridium sp. SM-530-WT-3G]|uniref:DUF6398 domain-containing protein n=1 Tax=Clostridium sp. SM-530-WT-3G TaxID=2725303 RepID=UPI00145E4C35|nr:DUF6398 domain-containing protein [Clostridium sp. SM-530-WT-3G]NME81803.1 hypothetical protein [Clostridium sp. SM-530-WT-3G]